MMMPGLKTEEKRPPHCLNLRTTSRPASPAGSPLAQSPRCTGGSACSCAAQKPGAARSQALLQNRTTLPFPHWRAGPAAPALALSARSQELEALQGRRAYWAQRRAGSCGQLAAASSSAEFGAPLAGLSGRAASTAAEVGAAGSSERGHRRVASCTQLRAAGRRPRAGRLAGAGGSMGNLLLAASSSSGGWSEAVEVGSVLDSGEVAGPAGPAGGAAGEAAVGGAAGKMAPPDPGASAPLEGLIAAVRGGLPPCC